MAIRFLTILILLTTVPFSAFAQKMKAMPAASVEEPEMLAAPPGLGSVAVLELFAAGSCPFSPQAEDNLKDLAGDPGIIGYICQIDYFGSGQDENVTPFCAARQDFYNRSFRATGLFTPQMILNGAASLSGRDAEQVKAAIQTAKLSSPPASLEIARGAAPGSYAVALSALDRATMPDRLLLRVVLLKGNVALHIADAGLWNGTKTSWPVTPPADTQGDAFIAMVQDRNTGRIVAAGKQNLETLAEATISTKY